MAYPTPSIYDYRARHVPAPANNEGLGQWFAEFSTDSGSTWRPLNNQVYGTETEVFNQIAFVVGSEEVFQEQFEAGTSFVPPAVTTSSYPPS